MKNSVNLCCLDLKNKFISNIYINIAQKEPKKLNNNGIILYVYEINSESTFVKLI